MKAILKILARTLVALLGVVFPPLRCLGRAALGRVSAVAAACVPGGHRFYSAFLVAKVVTSTTPATPAERLNDGRLRSHQQVRCWAIFAPSPVRWSAHPGCAVRLPAGTLWLIVGAVLGGCVQDFVILCCSLRRDGKSLGQMAREEVSRRGGWSALLAVLAIMIILLAVVALVVVNALKASPWGTSTLAMTIPIAMLVGIYMRYLRPGRVLEASAIGFALIMFSVVAGQWVAESPEWARVFTLGLAWPSPSSSTALRLPCRCGCCWRRALPLRLHQG